MEHTCTGMKSTMKIRTTTAFGVRRPRVMTRCPYPDMDQGDYAQHQYQNRHAHVRMHFSCRECTNRDVCTGERRRLGLTTPERRSSLSYSDYGDLEASVASLHPTVGIIAENAPDTRPASRSPSSLAYPTYPTWTNATMNGKRTELGKVLRSLVPTSLQHSGSVWTARSNYARDTRILFRRRITTLYLSLTSLNSYVELNYAGFSKILKK
jgi:hypothetical protein